MFGIKNHLHLTVMISVLVLNYLFFYGWDKNLGPSFFSLILASFCFNQKTGSLSYLNLLQPQLISKIRKHDNLKVVLMLIISLNTYEGEHEINRLETLNKVLEYSRGSFQLLY